MKKLLVSTLFLSSAFSIAVYSGLAADASLKQESNASSSSRVG